MNQDARKFGVGTRVVYSQVAGKEYRGKPAGTILGYSGNYFPIVMLETPDPDGDLAKVFHDSVLTRAL